MHPPSSLCLEIGYDKVRASSQPSAMAMTASLQNTELAELTLSIVAAVKTNRFVVTEEQKTLLLNLLRNDDTGFVIVSNNYI